MTMSLPLKEQEVEEANMDYGIVSCPMDTPMKSMEDNKQLFSTIVTFSIFHLYANATIIIGHI